MSLRIDNINNIETNTQNSKSTNFRQTKKPIPNDTVDIKSKQQGFSNGQKLGMGLGIIATIVSGIFLHKYFNKKATTETVEQVAQELTQKVKNLVSQGRITQSEAVMFNTLHNLEGEEFVRRAYSEIAKEMNLTKYPKLIVSLEDKGLDLGHSGEATTIYIKGYENLFGKEHAKEEIINTLRHELEHYKQDIIIFLQNGEKSYRDAFFAQKSEYIARKTNFRSLLTNKNIADTYREVLSEEAANVGYNEPIRAIKELLNLQFEHETPIKTIRTMTPCDFERLHLTPEELAKADEYLNGVNDYISSDCFPKEFYKPNGRFNFDIIGQDESAIETVDSYLHTGYVENPLEVGARQAGETLADKFRAFLDAIQG